MRWLLLPQQPVAVIGGGNTAVEEALYLSNIAEHVTVVHRRDKFTSEKILSDQLMEKAKNGNVSIEWKHTLEEVLGDDMGVNGLRLKSSDGDTKDLDVHGSGWRIYCDWSLTQYGCLKGNWT